MPKWVPPQGVLLYSLIVGSVLNLCLYMSAVVVQHKPDTQVLMAAMEQRMYSDAGLSRGLKSQGVYKRAVRVPLEQDDRALMLTATLDNQYNARFILDTGATYTAISPEMAKKLGYDLTNVAQVKITTANGQVSLPKVTLKSLTVNGYTAHNVEATVMPMPKNVPFTGLLGLSFVKRHRITIDSQAEHLVIEPQGL